MTSLRAVRAPAVIAVACALGVGACSSGARPASSNVGARPSLSATISPMTSASPRLLTEPGDGATPSTTPSSAPIPEPVRSAEPSVPPAAGTYTYEQSGSTMAGSFSIPVDKTGTLEIDRATSAGDGAKRQRHLRRYSSRERSETVLLFTAGGVYLESTTTTMFGFSQECDVDEPLLGVKLPLRVGATWSDTGHCDGFDLRVNGKVLRTERYQIDGRRLLTYVVRVSGTGSGAQGEQTTTETMWLSPDYRLSVHGVSNAKGTMQGTSYSRSITETLTSLTPA